MFILKLNNHIIIATLIVCIFLIRNIEAGYTSEELDEKSKSLYKAETSILASTEDSKHHHKHTYNSSPCASGGCPGALTPCYNPSGCSQPAGIAHSNSIGYSANPNSPSIPSVNTNGGYGAGYAVTLEHGNLTPIPQTPYSVTPNYRLPLIYQAPSGAYATSSDIQPISVNGPYRPPALQQPLSLGYASAQPAGPAAYPHWNSHYGYQGPRGYSVYDHSLKLNTEYTEVGTHTGPLQRGNNGYGGGYNGLFNRPGF